MFVFVVLQMDEDGNVEDIAAVYRTRVAAERAIIDDLPHVAYGYEIDECEVQS